MFKNKLFKSAISIVLILSTIFAITITTYATVGNAYSIGGGFHNGDDVRSACDYFALCGYKSYYSTNPTYAYISDANRLNSSVLYFSAHGLQDGIYLLNNLSIHDGYGAGSGQSVDIRNYSLSNTQLVVYDACLTASNLDGTGINLCSTTLDRGAKAVLGWRVVIGVDDAFAWEKRFQNYLALGNTINNSIAHADSYNYNDNAAIKNHAVYGDGNLVIKKSSLAVSSLEPTPQTIDIADTKINFASIDYNALATTIKTKIPNFNANNYKITATSTSLDDKNFVIDYNLKVGEFVTNSAYTIIVTNNHATKIIDNSITNIQTKKAIKLIKDSDKINASAEAAQIVANRKDGSTVKSQRGELYLELETGKQYYKVFTVYNYANTSGVGAFTHLYEIK